MTRDQHAVAEHIARHVADADDGQLLGLGIASELSEMALDQLPGAARCYPQRLVVVSCRAARSERVAEPESVFLCDGVDAVRERGGALVGSNHQIRVVLIVPDRVRRRSDTMLALTRRDYVVGQIQQAADHRLLTLDCFLPKLVAGGGLLNDEPAL